MGVRSTETLQDHSCVPEWVELPLLDGDCDMLLVSSRLGDLESDALGSKLKDLVGVELQPSLKLSENSGVDDGETDGVREKVGDSDSLNDRSTEILEDHSCVLDMVAVPLCDGDRERLLVCSRLDEIESDALTSKLYDAVGELLPSWLWL